MLRRFVGASRDPKGVALAGERNHQKEWMAAADRSDCARNFDRVLKELGKSPSDIDKFKKESFDKIYEALGAEVDGSDLARALVIRNEKFGRKTGIFLTIITLGLFVCLRPRDDATVVVLTKHGRIVQLKVDRPACCPNNLLSAFFALVKWMGVLFVVLGMPLIVLALFNGRTVGQELHALHLDAEGLAGFPEYAVKNRMYAAGVGAVLLFVICTFMPHDYRDKRRRRHVLREVAASQYELRGFTCRRRSSIRLYFGSYPGQQELDLAGNLGNSSCCGPVSSSLLMSGGRVATPMLLVLLTIFLSLVSGLDTFFTWYERSAAIELAAAGQAFCVGSREQSECGFHQCKQWGHQRLLDLKDSFCHEIFWEESNPVNCVKFGHIVPCCSGCQKGAIHANVKENSFETFKSIVSVLADIGTLLFTYVAARYALSQNGYG